MFCFGPLKTHTLHTLATSNSLPLKIGLNAAAPKGRTASSSNDIHFQGRFWLLKIQGSYL